MCDSLCGYGKVKLPFSEDDLTSGPQNDILFLTELDTPLNNADHVESF